MKTRVLHIASVLFPLIFVAAPLSSQEPRQISAIRDITTTEGEPRTAYGLTMSEPDIYYIDNGDTTFKAMRLTVKPVETPAAMTAPYLNEPTAHSI